MHSVTTDSEAVMATVKKLAYYACTALIVLLFGMAGVVKLTPALSSKVHNEIVSARGSCFEKANLDCFPHCSALHTSTYLLNYS